ncbi:MAG: hypothetical protein WC975_00605 [Phycisphaerae bacterium]
MYTPKELFRIADRILDELVKLHQHRYKELLQRMSNVSSQLSDITQTSKQLAQSINRTWSAAAERCRDRMNRDLYFVSHAVGDLQQLSQAPKFTLPAVRTIYEELLQVQDEFEEFSYDFEENHLSVDTQPIELDDLYLGSFQIQLEVKNLWRHYDQASYYVFACDPHTASSNDEVTHPHVSSDRLCEGDGSAAINMALHEGRIYDFFTLVSNILNTYNAASAYVTIEDWNGRSCYECGSEMSEDYVYFCQFCSREFCEECSSYCHSCDTTVCLSCLDRCPECEERVCKDCLKTCKECGQKCCTSCMDDNELICPNCKTESEENENVESSGNNERESETRTEGTKVGSVSRSETGEDTGTECQDECESADTATAV